MLLLFLNAANFANAQDTCAAKHPAPACNLVGPLVACLYGGADTITATIDFSGRYDSLVFTYQTNTTGSDIVDTNFVSFNDSEYIQQIILAPGTQTGSINLQLDVYIRYPDGCLMHCECSKSITIINVTATASFRPILCYGDTTTLTVVGAGAGGASSYVYTLSPGNITNTTGIFTGLPAGVYSIDVKGTKTLLHVKQLL